MKKVFCTCLYAFVLIFLMGACNDPTPTPTPHKPTYDAALLPGHWVSGTLHEYYDVDGTGHTWDTADDIYEEEAQPFTWSLTKATLVQNHLMEMGGVVPKTYILTKLNATTLCYHDSYGTSYTFIRQE